MADRTLCVFNLLFALRGEVLTDVFSLCRWLRDRVLVRLAIARGRGCRAVEAGHRRTAGGTCVPGCDVQCTVPGQQQLRVLAVPELVWPETGVLNTEIV